MGRRAYAVRARSFKNAINQEKSMFGRITGQPSSSNQAQQIHMQASVQTPEPIEEGGLKRKAAADHLYKGDKEFAKAAEHSKKTQDWSYEERRPGSIPLAVIGSLTPSPKGLEACPQEKHQWVAQVFETILKQFQDLDLCQSSPSLFLVYAHNNNRLGKADAEVSQRVIQWLSNLRSSLQSDRSASAHQALPLPATPEETARANDILSSQLCLLPNHAGTVDHVVLCGSELLGHYMASPYYQDFCKAIQRAYQEASQYANDFAQIEAAIRKVVDANVNEKEFHHVLTELAFLQIRYAYHKEKHGVIPLLLNSTALQCLPKFIIGSTAIRIEDSIWRMPSQWDGKQTYQDEGLHIGFFKLLKRLFVKQERCIALVEEKIYYACLQKLREDHAHTLTAEEFSQFLNQSCVTALEALKREHGADLRELNVQKAYENILTAIKQIKGEAPVAPDQLRSLRSALAESYSAKSLAIQRVSGEETSLNRCYINLAIVESQAQREKDKEKLEKQAKTLERLPSDERLDATNLNKLIPLERLFETQKLRNGSEAIPKRILIQGRAGVGKTTLCKKLVYEYHHNKLWQDQFDCVLWVPLRQLKTSSPQRFEDLLCNQYFRSHERSRAEALAKTFYDHRDKTLFILDGLDEVISELADDRSLLKGFLEELLNQKHVVVTSRPAGVDTRVLGQLDLELETIGFSPENVQTYIEKFAPLSTQAAILHFIHRTPIVQSLVNIPIQLDALCYSWDRLPKNEAVTMSMLYEAMVDKLWRKDCVRLDKKEEGQLLGTDVINSLSEAELEKLMIAEIDYLGYLAFKGLEAGRIEFSRKDLGDRRQELNNSPQAGRAFSFNFTINLKKTSYLHTADAELPEAERRYHFLHLTFQEFFAAKFLVRHLQANSKVVRPDSGFMFSQAELERFIAQHKYNPRYEIVWWMVAGVLEGDTLQDFFNLLEAAPRDLIGGRHQQVMMGCLNEARSRLKKKIVDRLETSLMQWLLFDMQLRYGLSELGRQRTFPEHLLLTSLCQSDNRKRQIIQTLGARPELSETAVQALVSACQDQDWNVRSAAARALESQRTLPKAAVHALITALQDQVPDVRSSAASALEGQATLSKAAVQALIGTLQDENGNVRWSEAVLALRGQSALSGAARLALSGAFHGQDSDVISEAVLALERQSALSEAAVQALVAALQHEKWNIRYAAVLVLRGQSQLSEAAVQALIGALHDENWNVRAMAASALRGQSPLPEAGIKALISVLQDENEVVRSTAAIALGRQSVLSEAAIQALIGALQDQCKDVRFMAARVLGGQSPLPEATVQALIGALQDENEHARFAAAIALGSQSVLSEAAVQALIGACQDRSLDVRSEAARVLGGQGPLPEAAVQALIAALQDENEHARRFEAAFALNQQETLPEAAVQALIHTLQAENGNVRSAAAFALRGHSPSSETTVQALIAALQDENVDVRSAAANALGDQRSPLSEATVQALIGACQAENGNVRYAAVLALAGQSPLSEAAVQALIDACQAENWPVSWWSAVASALGPHLDFIYTLLPSLSSSQIETLYRGFLFKYSGEHIAPLYAEDNQLHFYTERGPRQTDRIDKKKINEIIQAFEAVQIKEGIISSK